MIAYHFPPFTGGSGVLRTLKFCKYLPEFGWSPQILTVHPRAYPTTGVEQLEEIPPHVPVHRVFALDTGEHLAIRGIYPRLLALPDRWVSWWVAAVIKGWRLIKAIQPDVIWSTYPIATAHLIGLSLHQITGIPWVADFRDSMTEEGYPRDRATRNCYLWIEKKTVECAQRIVFTTESTREMYLNRYEKIDPSRCQVIQNGYDETDFKNLEIKQEPLPPHGKPLRLVHAGLIYPDERNPRPFFQAISRLKKEGAISFKDLHVELRGAGASELYRSILKKLSIEDLIFLLPSLPYQMSLEDCMNAHAFLIFQGVGCNHQIPAKVYENLRMGKPILALTNHVGDTAKLLNYCEGSTVLDMADEEAIYEGFPIFLSKVRRGGHSLPNSTKVKRFSRQSQACQLAECFQSISKNGMKNL